MWYNTHVLCVTGHARLLVLVLSNPEPILCLTFSCFDTIRKGYIAIR